MDRLEIAHRRLHNQHLAGPPLPDPVAVVSHHGAMQAQEYAVAKWSVGQRTSGFKDAGVQQAIDDGRILRTHALRPTWHFVAARDIRWLQSLTGPRVHAFNAHYYRVHEMDEAFAARTNVAIASALRGSNYLTRKELAAILAKEGMAATGNKLAYIMVRAELDGLIANGPMRGKQHTYALISERAPDAIILPPEEALAELTLRYFTSHGPATVKDFSWWSSLTVKQIKEGLRLVGSKLTREEVDGIDYWFAPVEAPARGRGPVAHVLQGYDEYFVGYTQSRSVANLASTDLAASDAGGPNENTLTHAVTVDSQLFSFWRRTVARGGQIASLISPVQSTLAQRRAVAQAFERYSEFIEAPVDVQWPDAKP